MKTSHTHEFRGSSLWLTWSLWKDDNYVSPLNLKSTKQKAEPMSVLLSNDQPKAKNNIQYLSHFHIQIHTQSQGVLIIQYFVYWNQQQETEELEKWQKWKFAQQPIGLGCHSKPWKNSPSPAVARTPTCNTHTHTQTPRQSLLWLG